MNIRKSLDRLAGKRITSKTEAEVAFDEFKVRLRNGEAHPAALAAPAAALTLADLLTRYQRDYLSRRPSAVNTDTQIAAITRTMLPHGDGARAFGEWPVAEVTESALWAYRAAREIKTAILDKDGKPTKRAAGGAVTVNRDVQLLRRAFNWALAAMPGEVRSSPFTAGKPPKGLVTREAARSRRLQDGEAARLLAGCGPSLPPCRSGLGNGMPARRIARAAVARREPPRTEARDSTASRQDEDTSRSHGADLGAAASHHRDAPRGYGWGRHEADAYVFGHQATGQRVTTIKTAWRLAMKRSKITDLHFHDLRREAASRWLDAGIRLSAVSKLLGHTTTEQTATYLACVLDAEHDAIATFDA